MNRMIQNEEMDSNIDVKIDLTKEQIDFLTDEHPIKIFLAGRQWGKSHALKAGLQKTCSETAGKSAVIMPVQNNCNDFFEEYWEAFKEPHEYNLSSQSPLGNKNPKVWPIPKIWYKSGHRLEFLSFEKNPKRCRGGQFHGLVCLDEANDLKGSDVETIILPKVSTTKAQVLITSTISHYNWLWDYYLRGQTNDRVVKSWLYPTSTGFKFQGKEGIQRLEDLKSVTPTHIWNSEYDCIPGSDNSTAFPYWDRCLIPHKAPTEPQEGKQYIAGLDLGRTRDHTVLVIMDSDGLIVLVYEFPLQLEHEVMAFQVGSMMRFWKAQLIIDSTGKGGSGGTLDPEEDSYIEIYKKYVPNLIPFCFSGNRDNETKYLVITHLELQTQSRRISCPKEYANLNLQMKQYRILKARGKSSTFGPKPGDGNHDDCVMALSLCCWGKKMGWMPKPRGNGQPAYLAFT